MGPFRIHWSIVIRRGATDTSLVTLVRWLLRGANRRRRCCWAGHGWRPMQLDFVGENHSSEVSCGASKGPRVVRPAVSRDGVAEAHLRPAYSLRFPRGTSGKRSIQTPPSTCSASRASTLPRARGDGYRGSAHNQVRKGDIRGFLRFLIVGILWLLATSPVFSTEIPTAVTALLGEPCRAGTTW